MAQFSRPDADFSKGTFSASTGSDLYAMIDEVTANDTDYIYGNGTQCDLELSSISDPGIHTGHIVRLRAKRSAANGHVTNLQVFLNQGAAVIQEVINQTIDENWTDFEVTLNSSNAGQITDYSDLRLVIGVSDTDTSDDQERDIHVSWAELETPDAGSGASNAKRPLINGSAINYGLVQ